MGDIWNPFDKDNPVYAQLAKDMKTSRRRVRTGSILTLLAIIVVVQSSPAAIKFNGASGYSVNQFGVIHRK